MKALNLTQHTATPEQKLAGVIDLPEYLRKELIEYITFEEIPSPKAMEELAAKVAKLYERAYSVISNDGVIPLGSFAMVGGAPYFQRYLEDALRRIGVEPLHAFSVRESADQPQNDGTMKKVAVFRHAGWVTTSQEVYEFLQQSAGGLRKG